MKFYRVHFCVLSLFPRFILFLRFTPLSALCPFFAFYLFFRILSLFLAFYPFFRILSLFLAFYPFFRVLSLFPRFIPFSASGIPYIYTEREREIDRSIDTGCKKKGEHLIFMNIRCVLQCKSIRPMGIPCCIPSF